MLLFAVAHAFDDAHLFAAAAHAERAAVRVQ